jgi:hypothetical protein
VEEVGPCRWEVDNDLGRLEVVSAGTVTLLDGLGQTLMNLEPDQGFDGFYYQATPTGVHQPGAFITFRASGDAEGFPPFEVSIRTPDRITVTSTRGLSTDFSAETFELDQKEDYVVTWTGGSPEDRVVVFFSSIDRSVYPWKMTCTYPAQDGIGIVPTLALSLMPLGEVGIEMYAKNTEFLLQGKLEVNASAGDVFAGTANHVH